MNRSLLMSALLMVAASVNAQTENVHDWRVGSSAGWGTEITVTNACNNDSVDVVMKLWTDDGQVFANRQLSASQFTDANGEVAFHLTPHQSAHLSIAYTHLPTYTSGNASVTTYYAESGVKCLVGGYRMGITKVGAPHPYGLCLSYLLNGGDEF